MRVGRTSVTARSAAVDAATGLGAAVPGPRLPVQGGRGLRRRRNGLGRGAGPHPPLDYTPRRMLDCAALARRLSEATDATSAAEGGAREVVLAVYLQVPDFHGPAFASQLDCDIGKAVGLGEQRSAERRLESLG